MPPKATKGQQKGKSGEEERDEPLQAVVSSAMRLAAKFAKFVRYSRIPLRHASVPSRSSDRDVFCPSRIPRSSSTRSNFSPTPVSKRSLSTAAHTGSRLRNI
ncbi:GCD1 Nucleoside-diphosphate-sugar pyrophosphorylase [Pyrenophora tritici-repentis]|nr:GCD1 Nucleoside-diphosphate-sugar pyrophosphorylase [Pyrenophora tritici-repentis]KAI1542907.1 GCD1 Nucleoside-diphosphate-sugar pyrophosphorylase [Pyrenophora tritici-repentis]KAI1568076.1 GCD1 Nucleoside-diphosphate-sugar pyrophosphorylase [Pyrenophora tritici-repentis]KAI1570639.1 GCD1 Nucleoside-diphosphate-sugar pyrophosphorylase [Pyrenophora tritici-repentis]KAI1585734.1 GCD1 Nucleoside-diphosphate-sugar pyrophosphorylase [Pyrenophora tritici-repentis]